MWGRRKSSLIRDRQEVSWPGESTAVRWNSKCKGPEEAMLGEEVRAQRLEQSEWGWVLGGSVEQGPDHVRLCGHWQGD